MTIPGPLFVVLAACIPIAAGVLIFYFIPNTIRSLVRYKLWHVRDDLVDSVLLEGMPRVDFVMNMIALSEAMIMATGRMTYLNHLLSPDVTQEERLELRKEISDARRELTAEQWAMLCDAVNRLNKAARSLRYASISGWVLGPICYVFGLACGSQKDDQSTDDVSPPPPPPSSGAWDLIEGRRKRELASCV